MIWGRIPTRDPCHLSCWVNLIYHLNDLPAQFGRVTSNVSHTSFQNIRMIGMPFQTWLLDLEFQNVTVTCFGNRIVMHWFFLRPGSGQYMPDTPITCHHKFQPDECNWTSTLHCIAFLIFLLSLPIGCVLLLRLPFFTPTPLMSPSSPNTKP